MIPCLLRRCRFVALLWLAGCTQVLELDSFQTRQTGTLDSCGGLPYAGASCGSCISAHCCPEAASCATEGVCSITQTCFSACAPGDVSCFGQCSASTPYDTLVEHKLEQCLATACQEECQVGCARSQSPSRARCWNAQTSCCETERAVWSDPPSAAWLSCQSRCTRASVQGSLPADACDCVKENPGSETLATAMAACSEACRDVGPDWSCLGKVKWPSNNDGTVATYRVRTLDLQSVTPIPDVHISACAPVDPGCSPPLGSTFTSDAQGEVTLSLTQRITSSSDYVGYFLQQGPSIVDVTTHIFPPLRQSETGAHALVTPQTLGTLHSAVSIEQDPALGTIGLQMFDCSTTSPAEGVRVTLEGPGELVYVGNAVPERGLSETAMGGQVLIYGVPPGRRHLEATLAATGQRIGAIDVVVRAGGFALALFPPTP